MTITSLRPSADEPFTWDLPEPVAKPKNPDWVLSEPLPEAPAWFTARQTIVGVAILLIAVVHVVNIGNWPLFFDRRST